MEFVILGNCTLDLSGVLRLAFVLTAASCPGLSQRGAFPRSQASSSGDGVLPLIKGPEPVTPKDPLLLDMSILPT